MEMLGKKVLVASVLAVLAGNAVAASPFSYNVSGTTDYRFRGISQSANGPALQGGADYTHSSGAYAGIWGSTIDFQGDAAVDLYDANLEIDLYGGYKFKTGPVEMDVGAIYYAYPGSESSADLDFFEIYAGGTFGPGFAKLFYTPDYTGNLDAGDGAFYLTAGANVEVGGGYTVGASVGKSWGDDIDAAWGDSYIDYKVGVSKEFFGVNFNLSYVKADLDTEITTDEFNSEGTVVLTATKTF